VARADVDLDIGEATEAQLGELIRRIAASKARADTDEGRIRDFYRAYLDIAAIEGAGLGPVQADLARFAAIADRGALSRVLGEQLRADVDPLNSTNYFTENLFGAFVTQALAGGEVMPYLLQGGLGMPDRDFYLEGGRMAEMRTAYQAHVAKMLVLAGETKAFACQADAPMVRANACRVW
jgi:predicted metalloendopeptidase